jgi:hypothetical protein
LESLDPMGRPSDAAVVEVPAEIIHHLAEAARALGGQKRNDRPWVSLDFVRVEQFADRPSGQASFVECLAKLTQGTPVRKRARLMCRGESSSLIGAPQPN